MRKIITVEGQMNNSSGCCPSEAGQALSEEAHRWDGDCSVWSPVHFLLQEESAYAHSGDGIIGGGGEWVVGTHILNAC